MASLSSSKLLLRIRDRGDRADFVQSEAVLHSVDRHCQQDLFDLQPIRLMKVIVPVPEDIQIQGHKK